MNSRFEPVRDLRHEGGIHPTRRLLFALVCLSASGGTAQAMLGSKVLASPFAARLTNDGAPIAGQEIVQEILWSNLNRTFVARTTTDLDGRFSFPEVGARSLIASVLPLEPLIYQKITTSHGGHLWTLWLRTKRDYRSGSEFLDHGVPNSCDLAREGPADTFRFGICRPA